MASSVRLQIECPPLSQPAWVDRDLWEKIVLNPISNAFKFTHEGHYRGSSRRKPGIAARLPIRFLKRDHIS
jgi:signal transduction histidine kinase